MSGNAQFDLHPDAESLNAFAEQALAGKERERIVAHLALCGRCREVVFLAQEANVGEPALVAAAVPRVAGREPWFRNWRLAWVPVTALAAGIMVAYVNHVRHVEPTQMAQAVNENAPVVAAPPARANAAKGSEKSAGAPEKKAGSSSRQLQQLEVTHEAQAPLPETNEPATAKENALQANAGVPAALKSAPERTVAERQRETAEVSGEMQGLAAKRAAQANSDKAEQAQDQMVAAAAPVMRAEVAPAPSAKIAGAANKVGGSLALYNVKTTGLPSRLTAVSTAIAEHNVLAVDKAGSLFLSTDAGVHWESIGRQWSGRALAVRTQAEVKADASAGGGTPQNVFELVNDQGQVWVSSDGRSWKTK